MGRLAYPEHDLTLESCPNGLLVTQAGRSYLARNWTFSDDVERIVRLAVSCGCSTMIQHGHPQESKLHPYGDGADYLTFSAKPDHRWTFVLDMDSGPGDQRVRQIKFNKTYKHLLRHAGIECPPEWRSPRHLNLATTDLPEALSVTAPYWDRLGPKRGRSAERGLHDFFIDEEDLHAHILKHWERIPILRDHDLVGSKQLLGSITHRQGEIDILSRDKGGSIYVIELKDNAVFNQGGETPEKQLNRYLSHPELEFRYGGAPKRGILIAQSVDLRLAKQIQEHRLPLIAYEATKASKSLILHEVARSPTYG